MQAAISQLPGEAAPVEDEGVHIHVHAGHVAAAHGRGERDAAAQQLPLHREGLAVAREHLQRAAALALWRPGPTLAQNTASPSFRLRLIQACNHRACRDWRAACAPYKHAQDSRCSSPAASTHLLFSKTRLLEGSSAGWFACTPAARLLCSLRCGEPARGEQQLHDLIVAPAREPIPFCRK
jgi:hypothetical protein